MVFPWETIGPIAGEEVWLYAIDSVNDGTIIHGSHIAFAEDLYETPDISDPSSERRLYLLGESDGSEFYEVDLAEGTSLIECLMMHGKAPVGWPGTAVNGDTLLTFSQGGVIARYETPAPSDTAVLSDTCTVDTEFRTSLVLGSDYGELWIDHSFHHLLPWRDGFLEFGYPWDPKLWATDRTRLVRRVSADGLDWTSPEPFPVPLENLLADDEPQVQVRSATASDGLHLVFAPAAGRDNLRVDHR